MADAAWLAELSADNPRGLTGNDTIRPNDDNENLVVAKYSTRVGAAVWSDAPQGEFLDLINSTAPSTDWLAGLNNSEANTFRSTHTVDGQVTLSNSATRTALTSSTGWTQAMTDAVTASYSTPSQTLYESLGLANIGKSGIREVLIEISDTWQYEYFGGKSLAQNIKAAWPTWSGTASRADLQSIATIMGI
jgi:hypothetical protein